ncbi:hypothetical protein FIBSPDRAFT_791982 [Athelia psychrophila]|uniref:BTB domain-containing protein n=1 Tax=Athelia psychrophila TaxID=1759441 RepID=A0A166H0I6_9AGAM|nr:hypothetical protein FIBSPDRAFT_791982 [Fibularhizoctonia sp. CBS 109695]
MALISEPAGGPVYPERSDPWFSDGNIVLEAEGIHFKVYQGILAANSSIFKDLFSFGQGDAEHIVEKCHVVQLSDKAEDLRIVLHSLHDCTRYDHAATDKKIPLSVLIAYLRLGRKYDIAHLSEIAMSKLALECPTTLEARQHIIESSSINWPRFIDIDCTRRHHFLLVNLIREHNILQYLPYALYICATPDPNDSFEEAPWSLFSPNPESNSDERYLSTADHHACTRGQKILGQLLINRTISWIESCDTCAEQQCLSFKNVLQPRYLSPIKIGYLFHTWDTTWENMLCPGCVDLCKNINDQGAQDAWNRLPSIFGLPSWEELAGTWYVYIWSSVITTDAFLTELSIFCAF